MQRKTLAESVLSQLGRREQSETALHILFKLSFT